VSELSVKMHIYQGFQLPLYSPGINEKVISSLWLTWLVKSCKNLLNLKRWVQLLNIMHNFVRHKTDLFFRLLSPGYSNFIWDLRSC
jgi:hypothetical protein